eukprot:1345236-Rhodomonas_salina.2
MRREGGAWECMTHAEFESRYPMSLRHVRYCRSGYAARRCCGAILGGIRYEEQRDQYWLALQLECSRQVQILPPYAYHATLHRATNPAALRVGPYGILWY